MTNTTPRPATPRPASRHPETGLILDKVELAERVTQYEIYAPRIAEKAQPGQFVIIRLSEAGERIPLTIVDKQPTSGSITLIVQTVGRSTEKLHQLGEGEQVLDVLGPLGNPSEIKNYGRVLVVGGGLGTALAYPVAKALKEAGNHVTVISGARNRALMILEDEIKSVSDEVFFTTDDGSYGFHGFVTQQLQLLLDAGYRFNHALAVGPLQMMHAVAEITRPYQISTIVSLNTIMVDGTGMCGGCRVRVGSETRFTCVDGPEFDGHLVDFDTIIKRNRAYNHAENCRLDQQIEAQQVHVAEPEQPTISTPRQQIPELAMAERLSTFSEVALGFSAEQAMAEAERCLQCRRPLCVAGCPVSVRIPEFIKLIIAGDAVEAGRLIKQDNALPRVCGRVCPQTEQCEGACILKRKGQPIAIGALERFAADALATQEAQPQAEVKAEGLARVALVGSGPACLSCAGDLAKAGLDVTVFEAFHDFGGVLRYGIPEFRLPKAIVKNEIDSLSALGVHFVPNTLIGSTYAIHDLIEQEHFDAVFIGTGAGLPNFLNISGESLVGVYSANEFLTRLNLMKAYQFPHVDTPILNIAGKNVAVIGGGNTALDSARVALRLGAREVSILYRRTEAEMPGRFEEIQHAKAEGIIFEYLCNPVAFLGNEEGWLTGVRLMKMKLGEPDASNRRRPIPIPGSEFDRPVDVAVVAIGNGSNPIIQKTTPGLDFDECGHIKVNPDTMETSMPGVYAGGDIVTGGATVILAMGAGRKAAKAIIQKLKPGVIA